MEKLNLPWMEKYRPRYIEDIVYQDHVKKTLRSVIKSYNMPHMLFFGPPGTGKTSAAMALCIELFGEINFKRRVLELNASDDRGINVVREKIKIWSKTIVGNISSTGKKLPLWKIVILDEADMMTSDAQAALRRIMEDNTKCTRFIIICNYNSKIIDPIISRCAIFRFEPIPLDDQLQRLKYILECENILATDEVVKEILKYSNGDLRVAVTTLQKVSFLACQNKLSLPIVKDIIAVTPKVVIENLILDTYFNTSNKELLTCYDDIINNGWDLNNIFKEMLLLIIYDDRFSDVVKARLSHVIAEAQFRLVQGAEESLQLLEILHALRDEGLKKNNE